MDFLLQLPIHNCNRKKRSIEGFPAGRRSPRIICGLRRRHHRPRGLILTSPRHNGPITAKSACIGAGSRHARLGRCQYAAHQTPRQRWLRAASLADLEHVCRRERMLADCLCTLATQLPCQGQDIGLRACDDRGR